MRLYPSKINELLLLIKSKKVKAVLLYGPEFGTISWIMNQIGDLFENIDEFSPHDSQELMLYLKSQDLFSKSKLVKIAHTSKLDKKIDILADENYDYFPVIIANEMPSTNSMRKFFETNEQFVAVSCYPDNLRGIEIFISTELIRYKKRISKDAIDYIVNHCETNRLIIANEIEKLALYTSSEAIGIADVMSVISGATSHEVDELCFAFMHKDPEKYFRLLTKIKNTSDIEPIMVIRAFIRYYNKLCIVNRYSDIEEGMKVLRPQVFFAHVDSFKFAAKKLSHGDIMYGLWALYQLEEKMKSNDNHHALLEELYCLATYAV